MIDRDTRLFGRFAHRGAVLLSAVAVTATCFATAPAAQAVEVPTPESVPVETAETVEVTPEVVDAPETPAIVAGQVAIVGAPATGSELRAETQGWEAGVALSYQWLRDDVPIVGATAERYLVAQSDAGAELRVVVTGALEGAEPMTVTSEPVTVPRPLAAAIPTIAGTAVTGKTLTAVPGSWTAGTAFTYQWLRGGKPIVGATQPTYPLTADDGGAQVSVQVTGALEGHVTTSKVSTKVLVLRTLTTATPRVTGTVKVGQTVKAAAGTWTASTTLKYQWLRDGNTISGATASSYKLASADAGRKVAVRVTGSKTGYASSAKTSTTVSVPKVLKTSAPSRSGSAVLGGKMKLGHGSWTSGTTFQYRWLRNGVAIKGGTKASYKLTTADLGKKISVRIKGSKPGYSSVVRTSTVSGAVKRPSPVVWRQTDPRWRNVRIGVGNVGPTGCVPTAFAMALWSEGVKASPHSVALTMHRKGDYNRGIQGAGSRSIVAAAKHYGVKVTPIRSSTALKASLKSGRTVIGLVGGPSSITRPGSTHAIALTGLTSGGSTFVRNPYGGTSNQHYSTSTLWSQQSRDGFDWNAGAVFWQVG